MSVRVVLCAFAAASCSTEVIGVELPPPASFRTAIVGVEYQGVLKLSAINLAPFSATAKSLLPNLRSAEGPVAMWALYYSESLEELELAEGALTETRDIRRARALPTPAVSYRSDIGDDGASAWSETSFPRNLEDYRFNALEEVCPEYDVREFSTFSKFPITALAMIDEESALAGAANGDFWRVSADGITPLPSIPGFTAYGAWTALDGELWLGGVHGLLFHGTPETGFVAATPSPLRSRLRWLAGPTDPGAPFELFTVSYDGAFERFDGTRWETLAIRAETNSSVRGGVAWVTSGEAIAVPPQISTIDIVYYHHRPNPPPGHTDEAIVTATRGEISALTSVPGLGVIALTKYSAVLHFDGTEFLAYEEPPIVGESFALGTHRRGFAYAGEGVSFAEYHPITGFCPQIDKNVGLFPRAIISLGRDLIITGDAETDAPVKIIYARRR